MLSFWRRQVVLLDCHTSCTLYSADCMKLQTNGSQAAADVVCYAPETVLVAARIPVRRAHVCISCIAVFVHM